MLRFGYSGEESFLRFKRLDLNLLVALDHMLNLRSITVAAERMNMSQSAMSNALTRLRNHFEDPLLVQVGRKMVLTPRAEGMRGPIRDILVRVEATIETDPVFRPETTDRQFSLLLSDYSLNVFMPHVFALAEKEGSRARFRLLPQTEQPYHMLERGEADMLIAPEQFCSFDHPSETLFHDHYVCLAWNEGKYAHKPVTVADYNEAGHVIMVPPINAKSVEGERLSRLGVVRREEVTCFSFSALPALLVGTNRLATVHGRTARDAMQRLPLVQHPVPFELNSMSQNMQWHEYRAHDPGIQWIQDLFRRATIEMNKH